MLSQDYPVSASCALLELPRSSYYHRSKPRDQQSLRSAIIEVAEQHPTYGSRRIAAQLKRAPYVLRVGRPLARRLMRELDLVIQPKRRRGIGTDSRHGYGRYANLIKGTRVLRPNQVWVADISYLRLGSDFIYLALVMDVYTRAVRGWHLSWSSDQILTLAALRQALQGHAAPQVHHSDRGSQYAANDYVKLLRDAGTQISMAAAGEPSENGYAERLIRTIKEEEVYLSDYQSMAEARQQLGHFIEVVYHKERVHSALDYLTPAEYERQWLQRNPLKSSAN
ncbi:MAG: IS3 family transposase [Chloroflexota bacterium]|nr:IS3 family transposase [Chloroflexota bacterium]